VVAPIRIANLRLGIVSDRAIFRRGSGELRVLPRIPVGLAASYYLCPSSQPAGVYPLIFFRFVKLITELVQGAIVFTCLLACIGIGLVVLVCVQPRA